MSLVHRYAKFMNQYFMAKQMDDMMAEIQGISESLDAMEGRLNKRFEEVQREIVEQGDLTREEIPPGAVPPPAAPAAAPAPQVVPALGRGGGSVASAAPSASGSQPSGSAAP